MLFLRSWLEDYVQLDLSDEELSQVITTRSSEVEEVMEISDYFGGKVVIGRIENVQKHPSSNKLQVFEVNLGSLPKVQIVSAAGNVRENLLVPVALIGARLPYFSVGAKKLAGIDSQGLCLGMSELALETNYSQGLWELEGLLAQKLGQKAESKPTNKAVNQNENINFGQSDLGSKKSAEILAASLEDFLGQSICQALPEFFPTQTVLDIKVLPDQISRIGHHLGMAIELATILEDLNLLTTKGRRALGFGPEFLSKSQALPENLPKSDNKFGSIQMKYSELESSKTSKPESVSHLAKALNLDESFNSVTFEDKFGGVNNFDLYRLKLEKTFNLPHLLQQRLFLTGRNLVGGLVDLSNYLLVDLGQPSHFFDAGKVID